MKWMTYAGKIIVCVLLSMLATMLATGIITRSIETLPGALLFGLFLSPSILIYYILDFFHKSQKAKTIGYVIPILAILVVFVVGLIFAMNEKSSEGEVQMATLILISIFVGGVVVYICMSKIKWLK